MTPKYIYKNLLWQFNKNPFDNLLGATTTEAQFFEQLEEIAKRPYPESRAVDTLHTEFCLDRLALRHCNAQAKCAMSFFAQYQTLFWRLKRVFGKKYLVFPADKSGTRLEHIAQLICQCTQFAAEEETFKDLAARTAQNIALTERERNYLWEVINLVKVNYFCACTAALLDKKPFAERQSASFLQPILLKCDFSDNTGYVQAAYASKHTLAMVDCLGRSATKFDALPTHCQTDVFVYCNKRNVFDTFVQSKFGQRHAEFRSEGKTDMRMNYFVDGNKEIRNCRLSNNGRRTRKFTVQVPLDADNNANYFHMGNALCVATEKLFCAAAVVRNGKMIEHNGEREILFDVTLEAGRSCRFDIVTLFAKDSVSLANDLANLERFGATNCPFLWDESCSRLKKYGKLFELKSHGLTAMTPKVPLAKQVNFSYRLGDNDVATFADNAGNSTTLLDGFVFGVKGESVYSLEKGFASKLNGKNFLLDADKLVYSDKHSRLKIFHCQQGKVFDVAHDKPMRTLFHFPLERTSAISFDAKSNTFFVADGKRNFRIICNGSVESYTSNAVECNEQRLRCALSGDLREGTCLTICLGRSDRAELTIASENKTPESSPIVRESLVSTYLNYVNDKNVFCLRNFLKRADPLTLAAICYTNPQFVKIYIENSFSSGDNQTVCYDAIGVKQCYCDKLAIPLAVVYYLNLVGELPSEWIKAVENTLFSEKFADKQLCIKALALQKAVISGKFDKVKCLLEYNNLKKQICSDAALFGYAQAIGAVPMTKPSKERLKDLCNKYDIPKSWYYVSQLENIYGLSISAGKLHIAPKISAENVLEQFALNIAGKRIDTSFAKASVQCMTINGQQCFSPFYAPSLKNDTNRLVVSY